MKYVVLVLLIVFYERVFANSICSFSPPDFETTTEFEPVDDDTGDPDQEDFVRERFEVDGYVLELIDGAGIREVLIKRNGEDFTSTQWNNDTDLQFSQLFPMGRIVCVVPSLAVPIENDETE